MHRTDRIRSVVNVRVETRVYSLEQDRLLWVGSSDTLDPTDTNAVIRDRARVIAGELRKVGVLAP